jgi:PTS system nitrogen regulatory IIA component
MELTELISIDAIAPNLKATNKKQALQELSKRAAHLTRFDDKVIYDVLLERERLGTTGVGSGIAIPHGKLEGLSKFYGIFARLEKAINFESIDEYPVDLIFLLLAPENAGADHLKALAQVSRLLRNKEICKKLRGTDNAEGLYALLTDSQDNSQSL